VGQVHITEDPEHYGAGTLFFEAKQLGWVDKQQPAAPNAPPILANWPPPIDMAALAKQQPEPPRLIMPGWLPEGYATLLAGHGGVGKSAIALHLAVCLALGRPFWGIGCEQRNVLYLSCEDREQILHWRLSRICDYEGIDIADLAGNLDVLDLVGHETTLWLPEGVRGRDAGTLTAAYAEVVERIETTARQVIFVDGISDTFGGHENDRSQVKRFVNALLHPVPRDGALLLIGHVAKLAATVGATNEGYSGSTGWHNAARARWYLYPETGQEDDSGRPQRTGKLVLEVQKANLGPADQALTFEWDKNRHLYVGITAGGQRAGTPAALFSVQQVEHDILRALADAEDMGDPMQSSERSNRNVATRLEAIGKLPASFGSRRGRKKLFQLLLKFKNAGWLTEGTGWSRARNQLGIWLVTAPGRGQCGASPLPP